MSEGPKAAPVPDIPPLTCQFCGRTAVDVAMVTIEFPSERRWAVGRICHDCAPKRLRGLAKELERLASGGASK